MCHFLSFVIKACNWDTMALCIIGVLPYGPLTRYVKLWIAQAPGMSGTFYPPLRVSDPDMHDSTCVKHVP